MRPLPLSGRPESCAFATMHGKDALVAGLARRFLGLDVSATRGIDTDALGTFTGEVPRVGGALDAARAKVRAARDERPDVHWLLASEGSFGPHPHLGFVPLAREIVLLVDESGQELLGTCSTMATNFASLSVTSAEEATPFALRCGFPAHGVIVARPAPQATAGRVPVTKDARTWSSLQDAVARTVDDHGSALLETDMRAHRNPTRQRAIRRAFVDLIRAGRSPCPGCGRPGFVVVRRVPGLPCGQCAAPTLETAASEKRCVGCSATETVPNPRTHADPGHCERCNP